MIQGNIVKQMKLVILSEEDVRWCGKDQYVVFAHWMLCCLVQWAMGKGGGLTSRDRLNSSENYLLLGFLLAMPSQTVLLLVR